MRRYGVAETVGKLRDLLNEFIEEHGSDASWEGWTDGCLYAYPKTGSFFIDNKAEEPLALMIKYQCGYCYQVRESNTGPVSCMSCSWRPMMKEVSGATESNSPVTTTTHNPNQD